MIKVLGLLSVGTASAQLKAIDTAGVKLGSSPEQVKAALLAFRPDFRFDDRALPASGGSSRRVVWIEANSGSALDGQSMESFRVEFSTTTGRALQIYRMHFVGSADQWFSVPKMLESLGSKYGGALATTLEGTDQYAVMAFTPDGKGYIAEAAAQREAERRRTGGAGPQL